MVLRTDPDTGETTLYIMVITLEGVGQSYSGTGSYLATTTLLSAQSTEYEIDAVTTISIDITTEYSSLWTDFINSMAAENSLSSPGDYTITTGTDTNGNPNMTLTFITLDTLQIRTTLFRMDIN